jgi:hypothetical protein
MNNHAIKQFCDWLSSTRLSNLFATTGWVVPVTQVFHILTICALVGAAVLFNLYVLRGLNRERPTTEVAARLLPWIWWSLPILLGTGIILTITEPARELMSYTFRYKMLLILAAMTVTAILQAVVTRDVRRARPGLSRALALVALVLWFAVVAAGRLIAYDTSAMSYY